MGGVTSTVSVGAASAFAVAVTGPEGGMLVGGSSSPGPAAEESSGPKGKEGRNSDGMGRGAMPGRFRGGKEGRGGRPEFISSGKLTPGMTCGVGRLRLGRAGRLGSPAGKGIRPGNVVAGFIGDTEARDWLTCDNNGTVGTPVLRTLLTAGGVELIESPDRLCSISVVPGVDMDGGLTEDSWTSVNPSLRGVIGVLVICPGREIFFPSSNGRVGIRCKYPYPMPHPRLPSPPHAEFGVIITSRQLSVSVLYT